MAGVGRRALQTSLPPVQRRGQASRVRLGHEEHQQPQRPHPEEVVPRSAGLLEALCPAERGLRPSEAGHLRQGTQKTTRYADK